MKSKSNGTATVYRTTAGYRTATGINHISEKQSYVTRLFLSTLALALILVVPRHWPELAITPTAPLYGMALWHVWIRKLMAHSWLAVSHRQRQRHR